MCVCVYIYIGLHIHVHVYPLADLLTVFTYIHVDYEIMLDSVPGQPHYAGKRAW